MSSYVVFVVRGYTKETLAQRIAERLKDYEPEDIVKPQCVLRLVDHVLLETELSCDHLAALTGAGWL